MILNTSFFLKGVFFLSCLLSVGKCQQKQPPGKSAPRNTAVVRNQGQGQGQPQAQQGKVVTTQKIVRANFSAFEDENRFCVPSPSQKLRPFYRSKLDGAVCCRGNIIQAATILPEISGDCAMGTKTDANGILNPAPLWCAYTCSLKKIGVMNPAGQVNPLEFYNHLSRALGGKTKENVRLIMEKYLKCMTPFKNPKFPCYTPLGFHKCYIDALEFLCTNGMPPNADFSKFPVSKNDYVNLLPTCEINGKQVMPTCCHGRPLPWTIPDIIEAPRDTTKMKTCMTNMQNRVCSATCFMHSAGVVDDSMELDVAMFQKQLLSLFPFVQPSIWMNFMGPAYVFFDETLEELGARIPTAARVCLFHDKILNFHEDKIQQYCEMTPAEVKAIKNQ